MVGLKTKLSVVEQVRFSERNKIIVDTFNDGEGSISFYWNIDEGRGKIIKKKCIDKGETTLVDV